MTEHTLQPGELQHLAEREHWLLFRKATEKISAQLEETQRTIGEINKTLSPLLSTVSYQGKISRGGNHEGFPYLVLDCPNYYTQKDTFAFRVMVWWGNHISIGLHLDGYSFSYLKDSPLLPSLAKGYWQNATNNPWTHQKEHYKKADLGSASDFTFLRLVQFYELGQINQLRELTLHQYQDLFVPLHEALKADK